VWDARSEQKRVIDWFDWKQFMPGREAEDLFARSERRQPVLPSAAA